MLYICLIFTSLILFLSLYFRVKHKKEEHVLIEKKMYLINQILKNKNQIYKRETNLKKYNFQQFNIEESLVPQYEIKL